MLRLPASAIPGKEPLDFADLEPDLYWPCLRLGEITADEGERGFFKYDGCANVAFLAPCGEFPVGDVGKFTIRHLSAEDADYVPSSRKEVVDIVRYLVAIGRGETPAMPNSLRLLKKFPRITLPPAEEDERFRRAYLEAQEQRESLGARLVLAKAGIPTSPWRLDFSSTPIGKAPCDKFGWPGATTSEDSIRKNRGPLLGIPLGKAPLNEGGSAPRIFVVDIDKHGTDGVQEWLRVLEDAGIDKTECACLSEQTANDGFHLFCSFPDEFAAVKRTTNLFPGIDLLTSGGVIIGPSIGVNRATGRHHRYFRYSDAPVCRNRTVVRLLLEKYKSKQATASNSSLPTAPTSTSAPIGTSATVSLMEPTATLAGQRERLDARARAALATNLAKFDTAGIGDQNKKLCEAVFDVARLHQSAPGVLSREAVYDAFLRAASLNGYLKAPPNAREKFDRQFEDIWSAGLRVPDLTLPERARPQPTSLPPAPDMEKLVGSIDALLDETDFAVATGLAEPPRENFLLEESLPEEGFGVLAAPPGVGKGWIALQLQFALAVGPTSGSERNYLPWRPTRRARSLYVSAEDGRTTLAARQWTYGQTVFGPRLEEFQNRIRGFALATPSLLELPEEDGKTRTVSLLPLFRRTRYGMERTEGFALLEAIIRRRRIDLVVLDTLFDVAPDFDEKSAQQGIGEAVAELAALAQRLHIFILTIHHARKVEGGVVADNEREMRDRLDYQQARGSVAIFGKARWGVMVTPLTAKYARGLFGDVARDAIDGTFLAVKAAKKNGSRPEREHYLQRLQNGLLRVVMPAKEAKAEASVRSAFLDLVEIVREVGPLPTAEKALWSAVREFPPFNADKGRSLLDSVLEYTKNPDAEHDGLLVRARRRAKRTGPAQEVFDIPADNLSLLDEPPSNPPNSSAPESAPSADNLSSPHDVEP